MILHSGAIAEMKTGEGKTLTATTAVFLNTLAGEGVHLVTVNDYLARRDAEWMKPVYDALGVNVAAIQEGDDPATRRQKYAADVTYGTNSEFGFDYLRDNMAGSLEECVQRGPRLRDRRRGRQHPDRRGPHAADHLGQARAGGRPLLHVRPPGEDDGGRGGEDEAEEPRRVQGHLEGRVRLRVRREAQDRRADRARDRQGRGVPRRREPLPLRARHPRQPPDPVAEGRGALQARHRVRRRRRPGDDHRRVHRPHPRGAALVGGPAPGDRGQGGRFDPRGEPDARDDHAPELLPPLRQALGHDRHGHDRGHRVHEDLQGPDGRDPDPPRHGPRRQQRRDLQDQGRQVGRRRQRGRGPKRAGPAGPHRDDLRRDLRDALRRVQEARHRPRRAERQARVRRARGRDDRAGRPPRRGDDRDQHGRPRRRHQARGQPRADGEARADQPGHQLGRRGLRGEARVRASPSSTPRRQPRPTRSASSAASTSSAPSATSRGASTTSFAAAQAARATPASRASSSRPRTT